MYWNTSSVVDPYPDPHPDSHSQCGCGSRRGKMTNKKENRDKISCFHVQGWRKKYCNFRPKKYEFFSTIKILQYLVLKSLDSEHRLENQSRSTTLWNTVERFAPDIQYTVHAMPVFHLNTDLDRGTVSYYSLYCTSTVSVYVLLIFIFAEICTVPKHPLFCPPPHWEPFKKKASGERTQIWPIKTSPIGRLMPHYFLPRGHKEHSLKVVGNEKEGGSERCQKFTICLWPRRLMFFSLLILLSYFILSISVSAPVKQNE